MYDHAEVGRAMAPMRDDLIAARERIEELEAALSNLMRRLDDHFGGPNRSSDWKEQEDARKALHHA